jgi:hypothetical protein
MKTLKRWLHNLNWEDPIPRISFAFILINWTKPELSLESFMTYTISGFLVLAAIVIFLEKKFPKPFLKSFISWAEGLKIAFMAFGVGLMLKSVNNNTTDWPNILLFISGVLLTVIGAFRLVIPKIGTTNIKDAIFFGSLLIAAALTIVIMKRDDLLAMPILFVIFILLVGSVLVACGLRNCIKTKQLRV